MRILLLMVLLSASPFIGGPAAAQTVAQPADPPWRPPASGTPIHLIVPFPPGGAADNAARIVVPPLAIALGRPIFIENRPGAGGMLGAEAIARAAPDGRILGISNASPNGTVPLVQPAMPYDGVHDFSHIALIAETPSVLVVAANSRFRSFEDYLRAGRSWTSGLTYGSTGVGTLQHLQGATLAAASGARLLHVPYRGSSPALQDLVRGQLDSVLTPYSGAMTVLASGQARALAVSSARPFAPLPGVPTYAGLGYPQLTATSWTGISGPRGLSPALVAQINQEVNRIITAPENRARLEAAGLFPPAEPMDAAAYQAMIARFGVMWGPVVKASGIQPQ